MLSLLDQENSLATGILNQALASMCSQSKVPPTDRHLLGAHDVALALINSLAFLFNH